MPFARLEAAKAGNAGSLLVMPTDPVLVTGAAGFIGLKVIERLVAHGFQNLRCFVRDSTDSRIRNIASKYCADARIDIFGGDLLSREDCLKATKDISVVYHLAVGTGGKSFADLFMNSVLTTRNLLEGCRQHSCLKRFVNVSSFVVYTNSDKPRGNVLDEACPIETNPVSRGDAYCFAKIKQDEIVADYGKRHAIPYVIVRPGVVYGPGKKGITGRVGIGTLGLFLHLGGSNAVPLTYVDNCADAIVLAGVTPGVDGEVLNIVDDHLPSSRLLLRLYKKNVEHFVSLYLPRLFSYVLFCLWEDYSRWSQGQIPPVCNRKVWHAYWKGSQYSNEKIKRLLGWVPRVATTEGLKRYFEGCRAGGPPA
jgi:nucleoside-diphosphate-sugar epimerase